MRQTLNLLLWGILVTTGWAWCDEPQPKLDPHLEPLRPLLDKTWKSTFQGSNADKPVTDVMRWERALNGKAVRVLHSVNDGLYGGETIFRWDEQQKAVTYYYFTTAGFMTTGKLEVSEGRFTTSEKVDGGAGGITEIRGTSELTPQGEFSVKTEYLKEGKWGPGRNATYRLDPEAKVQFK